MELELEQNTELWSEFRTNRIGASMAPIILGLSQYKTKLQLWKEMVGLAESSYTPAMEYGRQREAPARAAFIEKTGIYFRPAVFVHDKHPWLLASLDGYAEKEHLLCEIKCLNLKNHEDGKSKISPMYYAQIQHQLEVADCSYGYYVGYRQDDLYYTAVSRDEKFIKDMIEKEWEFYQDVINFREPKK